MTGGLTNSRASMARPFDTSDVSNRDSTLASSHDNHGEQASNLRDAWYQFRHRNFRYSSKRHVQKEAQASSFLSKAQLSHSKPLSSPRQRGIVRPSLRAALKHFNLPKCLRSILLAPLHRAPAPQPSVEIRTRSDRILDRTTLCLTSICRQRHYHL